MHKDINKALTTTARVVTSIHKNMALLMQLQLLAQFLATSKYPGSGAKSVKLKLAGLKPVRVYDSLLGIRLIIIRIYYGTHLFDPALIL